MLVEPWWGMLDINQENCTSYLPINGGRKENTWIDQRSFKRRRKLMIQEQKLTQAVALILVCCCCQVTSVESCPTLCDSIDGSPPGSPVPGIPQARTLEWVAISFSNAWKWRVKGKSFSCVRPSATPRTAAYQAPPSMGFSRQEYWSGVPLPSPEHNADFVQIWASTFRSQAPHPG